MASDKKYSGVYGAPHSKKKDTKHVVFIYRNPTNKQRGMDKIHAFANQKGETPSGFKQFSEMKTGEEVRNITSDKLIQTIESFRKGTQPLYEWNANTKRAVSLDPGKPGAFEVKGGVMAKMTMDDAKKAAKDTGTHSTRSRTTETVTIEPIERQHQEGSLRTQDEIYKTVLSGRIRPHEMYKAWGDYIMDVPPKGEVEATWADLQMLKGVDAQYKSYHKRHQWNQILARYEDDVKTLNGLPQQFRNTPQMKTLKNTITKATTHASKAFDPPAGHRRRLKKMDEAIQIADREAQLAEAKSNRVHALESAREAGISRENAETALKAHRSSWLRRWLKVPIGRRSTEEMRATADREVAITEIAEAKDQRRAIKEKQRSQRKGQQVETGAYEGRIGLQETQKQFLKRINEDVAAGKRPSKLDIDRIEDMQKVSEKKMEFSAPSIPKTELEEAKAILAKWKQGQGKGGRGK